MVDIVIVGAGICGLLNALYLGQYTDLNIRVMEAKKKSAPWSKENHDSRVYAINPASQTIFKKLNIWPHIASKRVSPYTHMQVWGEDKSEIHFSHQELNQPVLGHIIEENLIREVLYQEISKYPNIRLMFETALVKVGLNGHCVDLEYNQNELHQFRTKLLIGADGIHSSVREKCEFNLHLKDYYQCAIITNVETELPHQKTARQIFLPDTILAYLPLEDPNQCSIVWSTTTEKAARLTELSETAFNIELASTFQYRLGKIIASSPRFSFPLYERLASHTVKERIALIGDAAHSIHPMAGLGLNVGIADVEALSKCIIKQHEKVRDFGSLSALRAYERDRKGHHLLIQKGLALLQFLFLNQQDYIKKITHVGLNFTNQVPFIKNALARLAIGH